MTILLPSCKKTSDMTHHIKVMAPANYVVFRLSHYYMFVSCKVFLKGDKMNPAPLRSNYTFIVQKRTRLEETWWLELYYKMVQPV